MEVGENPCFLSCGRERLRVLAFSRFRDAQSVACTTSQRLFWAGRTTGVRYLSRGSRPYQGPLPHARRRRKPRHHAARGEAPCVGHFGSRDRRGNENAHQAVRGGPGRLRIRNAHPGRLRSVPADHGGRPVTCARRHRRRGRGPGAIALGTLDCTSPATPQARHHAATAWRPRRRDGRVRLRGLPIRHGAAAPILANRTAVATTPRDATRGTASL